METVQKVSRKIQSKLTINLKTNASCFTKLNQASPLKLNNTFLLRYATCIGKDTMCDDQNVMDNTEEKKGVSPGTVVFLIVLVVLLTCMLVAGFTYAYPKIKLSHQVGTSDDVAK